MDEAGDTREEPHGRDAEIEVDLEEDPHEKESNRARGIVGPDAENALEARQQPRSATSIEPSHGQIVEEQQEEEDARQAVDDGEPALAAPLEERSAAREDEVEVERDGGQQEGADHEDDQQHRLRQDLEPVVAADECSERQRAEPEESGGGSIVERFPVSQRADDKKPDVQREPEDRRDECRERRSAELAPDGTDVVTALIDHANNAHVVEAQEADRLAIGARRDLIREEVGCRDPGHDARLLIAEQKRLAEELGPSFDRLAAHREDVVAFL